MASEYSNVAQKYIFIVERYAGTCELHPLVQALNQDEKFQRKLVTVMQHEVEAIRSRSQDLDECEITVAQKAFVYFFASSMPAAVSIYVEEILGIQFAAEASKAPILQDSTELRSQLLEGMLLNMAIMNDRSS